MLVNIIIPDQSVFTDPGHARIFVAHEAVFLVSGFGFRKPGQPDSQQGHGYDSDQQILNFQCFRSPIVERFNAKMALHLVALLAHVSR